MKQARRRSLLLCQMFSPPARQRRRSRSLCRRCWIPCGRTGCPAGRLMRTRRIWRRSLIRSSQWLPGERAAVRITMIMMLQRPMRRPIMRTMIITPRKVWSGRRGITGRRHRRYRMISAMTVQALVLIQRKQKKSRTGKPKKRK